MIKRKYLELFIFFLLLYLVIILYKGYYFGGGQQVELLPYILYLANNSLYSSDLYIQSLANQVFHERFFFCWFLYPFHQNLELPVFIIHLITTFFLISGMVKIFRLFINNDYWIYAAIFIFFMTHSINTGGHELYYNTLHPSNIGIAFGIWSIYYFIKKYQLFYAVMLILSTWFHPMVGFQLFLLFLFILIIENRNNIKGILNYSRFFIIYGLLGGTYIGFLIYTQSNEELHEVSNSSFYNIIFKFRLIRHLDPSFYSNTAILMNSCLAICGLMSFYFLSSRLFWFITGILFGIVIYLIGFYFDIYPIVLSWWFRSTIWLKFLGWVALFTIVKPILMQFGKFLRLSVIILVAGVVFYRVMILDNQAFRNFNKNIQLPFIPSQTPEKNISKKIRKEVNKNAVFIHPYLFNALKYYGRVSSWVDYYAYPRRKDYAPVYMKRVNNIYGLTRTDRHNPERMRKIAKKNYLSLDHDHLQDLANKGVTHILTYAEHEINGFEKILENKEYKVYNISNKN